MHSFVNPNVVVQCRWAATKVAKSIKVQSPQKVATLVSEVVLGAVLECSKAKFTKNFIICTLDGIKAILGNTFLNIYHVDVLRGSFKLRIIFRLVDRFVSLEVEYHVSLTR
jgi:hypothetical protein